MLKDTKKATNSQWISCLKFCYFRNIPNYKSVIAISDIDNFGTDADLSIKMADEGELENDPTTDLPWQGGN